MFFCKKSDKNQIFKKKMRKSCKNEQKIVFFLKKQKKFVLFSDFAIDYQPLL